MEQTILNQKITLLPNDEFKAEIKIRENNLKEQEDTLKTGFKKASTGEIYIMTIHYKIVKI